MFGPFIKRVTCEEHPEGQVYEVDPLQGISTIQKTILGGSGGSYESFAYDARDPSKPTFYGKCCVSTIRYL